MTYELVRNPNTQCKTFWMMILLFICSFVLINLLKNKNEHFKTESVKKTNSKLKQNSTYNLGVCSKNCCATQWPLTINLTERSKVKSTDIGKKYYTSNLTCNNGIINTGCLCLTDESKKVFGNRGYIKKLPTGNGLLDEDNRKSVFKVMENKPRPNVLGQTTELTGKKDEKNIISGKNEYKYENRINSHRSVDSANEIAKEFSMPIDTNMIEWNNEVINNALIDTNISGNNIMSTESLLKNQIGYRDKDITVSRK
jgi:hypothetical protein